MGIFGVQIVFSLIAFSFLQKLAKFYSFGFWLLSRRLIRYLHPTNDQLKSLAGLTNQKRRKNNQPKYENSNNSDDFTVPRNIALELDTAEVHDVDLITLKFYPEYQWLLDYSMCAVVIYIATEIAFYLGIIKLDHNLSVMWCLLAMCFCVRVLLSQLMMYVKSEEGGERILCFAFALFFLIAAMAILLVDQEYLEFGLEDGYKNFSDTAKIFMIQNGYLNHGPVSINTFKIILAILCAFLGTFLTFPGLRFAKTYLDSLKYAKESPVKQVLLHLNFILPFACVLLWVKPIGRDLFCTDMWQKRQLLFDETFDMTRIGLMIFMCLLRISLLTTHLQSHLNLAYEKVQRMRKESGRISSMELQKMIARVPAYLCVVAIQYVAPMLLVLFAVLLLKTLGAYSWANMFAIDIESMGITPTMNSSIPVSEESDNTFDTTSGDSILDKTSEITATLGNLRNLFTHVWYRGVLSFIIWWMNASWFTTSLFGLTYYGRLADKI